MSVRVRANAELESRGKQSIRVDCGPAGSKVDIDHDDAADDRYDGNGDHVEEERNNDELISTPSYDESTDGAVTSSMTSSPETSDVAMTTVGVTSSDHVIDDHSSASLNNSCECMSNGHQSNSGGMILIKDIIFRAPYVQL